MSHKGERMPIIRSRPKKLNHADTVLYEIYMLRFAADRLKREQCDDQKDAWAHLEAFLLHYRNLIEFLGKKTRNIRPTDLHVTTIWNMLKATRPKEASQIHREGAKLWAKYEGVSTRKGGRSRCSRRKLRRKMYRKVHRKMHRKLSRRRSKCVTRVPGASPSSPPELILHDLLNLGRVYVANAVQ